MESIRRSNRSTDLRMCTDCNGLLVYCRAAGTKLANGILGDVKRLSVSKKQLGYHLFDNY